VEEREGEGRGQQCARPVPFRAASVCGVSRHDAFRCAA